jgi:hypothetical protein
VTRSVRAIVVVMAAALATGCAGISGPTTAMTLENFTDTAVAVHADGLWVGTYEAGANSSVPVPGEPPVRIEIMSPSGAVLAQWAFDGRQAIEGGVSTTEVPCGVIRLSVGRIELPAMDPSPPRIGECP